MHLLSACPPWKSRRCSEAVPGAGVVLGEGRGCSKQPVPGRAALCARAVPWGAHGPRAARGVLAQLGPRAVPVGVGASCPLPGHSHGDTAPAWAEGGCGLHRRASGDPAPQGAAAGRAQGAAGTVQECQEPPAGHRDCLQDTLIHPNQQTKPEGRGRICQLEKTFVIYFVI